MTDSHQAIYDAVRSRISNGNIGSAVETAIRDANIGHYFMLACDGLAHALDDHSRPSVLFRPTLSADGTSWCALYGDDLASGVAGFGDTPAEAMAAFDKAWTNELTPKAASMVRAIEEEDEREEAVNNGQFGVGA